MQQMDDPPYLSVGTEVSAKYKGAFCEAKVRKVVRNIKCKVAYKQGLGSGTISDDQIKGDVLRVGAVVEVKHPDRRDMVEATITKIQDCSQYTVVFDDGDITTLRRSALCLKSGRHFNESETLDQLPLTHPEHFGNPVMGGRRGRSCRSRPLQEDSSDEDEEPESKTIHNEKEEHIGKVVCVESTDTKKKGPKDNWFPALVVSPTTQDTVRIRVKDEYLVRSFKDGRYYTVPKKEATEFTREMSHKQEGAAILAALEYLDNDVLPPHWDRDALFGLGASSSDSEQDFDTDSSDDEPREEKDHFVAQLYKYMDDRGTPLNKGPCIVNRDVDLYRLFSAVHKLGGYNRVTTQNQWKSIAMRLGFIPTTNSITNLVKQAYKKFLQPFEEFNRKLGCTMVAHPRANRIKGRSLVRANSVASPKPTDQKEGGIKSSSSATAAEESENNSESGTDTIKSSKRKLSTGSTGKVKSLIDKFEERLPVKEVAIKEEPSTSIVEIPVTPTSSRASKSTSFIKEEVVAIRSRQTTPIPVKKEKKDEKLKEEKVEPVSTGKEKGKSDPKALEKRGRKKKESETIMEKNVEKSIVDTTIVKKEPETTEPFPIEIGDKLKVYYHEQKVTYEAKVIEISESQGSPLYLVHYTGWNTRYDEWVPKERIAENLTNNKSKRSKNMSKGGNSSSSGNNNSTGPSTTPTNSGSKSMSAKRGRGGSRGDSQPPRSTTPSSIASNSSRTKSPATTAQRRTTRGQPSSLRRTSNNTDISSLQTESDTDSDEPVKKSVSRPSHTRTHILPSTPTGSSNLNQPTALSIGNSSRSGSSQDEESYTSGAAKGRDFDLNQIRSELKGFKEIKSPSPEIEKSDIDIKTECEDDKPLRKLQQAAAATKKISGTSTDTSKTSSDLSSETDSMADDDSQSSVDKTTPKTEKMASPIKIEKGKIALKKSPVTSKITEISKEPIKIEKVDRKSGGSVGATTTGLEKIISTTPSKIIANEKEEKESVDAELQMKSGESEKTKSIEKVSTLKTDKTTPIKAEKKLAEKSKILSGKSSAADKIGDLKSSTSSITAFTSTNTVTVPDIYEFKEPEPFEFETTGTPSKKNSPVVVNPAANVEINVTVASTMSPAEKRGVKNIKAKLEDFESKPQVVEQSVKVAVTPPVGGKRKKNSPNKDQEKLGKQSKKEETQPVTTAATLPSTHSTPQILQSTLPQTQNNVVDEPVGVHIPNVHPPPIIMSTQTPSQFRKSSSDSTFDVLRKSPSFNINKAGQVGSENSFTDSMIVSPIKPGVFLEEKQQNELVPIMHQIPKHEGLIFDPNFLVTGAAIVGDTMTLIRPQASEDQQIIEEEVPKTVTETKGLGIVTDVAAPKGKETEIGAELESMKKKLLMADQSFVDMEPSKPEKTSIADKVLKALNQQQNVAVPIPTPVTVMASGSATIVSSQTIIKKEKYEGSHHSSPVSSTILSGQLQPSSLPVTSTSQTPKSILEQSVSPAPNQHPQIIHDPHVLHHHFGPTTSVRIEIPLPPPSIINKKEVEALGKKAHNTIGSGATGSSLNITEITDQIPDLSETIQKLKSAVSPSSHVPHVVATASASTVVAPKQAPIEPDPSNFNEDSSDSTDSEQRLFIEDESQSSENVPVASVQISTVETVPAKQLIEVQSQPQSQQNQPIKTEEVVHPFSSFSSFKFQEGLLGLNRQPLDKQQLNAVEFLTTGMIDRENERLSQLAKENRSTSVVSMVAQESGSILLGPLKNDESDEQHQNAQQNEPISMLLCEETIPGSPAPQCGNTTMNPDQPKKIYEAPFISQTMPHNTASDIKPVPMDIESVGGGMVKPPSLLEKVQIQSGIIRSGTSSSSPRESISPDDSKSESEDVKTKREMEQGSGSTKKRRRPRKSSDCEGANKRRKANAAQHPRKHANAGSDSDENSDTVGLHRNPRRSPKPCQYNFLVQLDASLSSQQRINILKKKIQELRKTYNMIKAELVSIDRRRKKLRRREREKNKLAKASTTNS